MTYQKRDQRDPDPSCLDATCLDGITGPIRWSQQNAVLVDFAIASPPDQSGTVNFHGLAPKGWWVKVDVISYSQQVQTAIPVVIEFFDPTSDTVDNAPVVRILDGTAAGGLDVHHFVSTNGGAGWLVPIADNGRPWSLRCITDKGIVTTFASFDVFYRYVPRVS